MALPNTKLQYYEDAYQTRLQTTVVETVNAEDSTQIYLAETIFFPQGGGQPCDQGLIKGPAGQAQIQKVTIQDGSVCHISLSNSQLKPEDAVTCELNWERRHWYMRVHTTGHLVHDALLSLVDGLTPHRGEHGDAPYLKYRGTVDDDSLPQRLEALVNQLVAEERKVFTGEATLEELQQRAKFIPPNLPSDKPLRFMQIEGFDAMPDGGVHVKTLGEIDRVAITDFRSKKGGTTVKYQVVSAESDE